VKFVYNITSKISNTEIVKIFMNCKSFSELYEKLKIIMPEEYKDGRTDIKKTLDDEVIKKIGTVLHYYKNWPDSYIFQERSISSLWQQSRYGEQAMNIFIDNNIILGLLTLHKLSTLSKSNFDTSDLRNFKVERRQEGINYRIIISW